MGNLKMKNKLELFIKQFFKFGIVGCINTFNSWIFYYSFLFFNVNYLISTTIAFILSSIIGFILNKSWVFQKKIYDYRMVIRYYIVYGSSYFLNLGCMYLLVDVLGISQILAPIFTLCVTVPYNFIFSRIWVFNQKEN